MSTGALVIEDLRAKEDLATAKPTATPAWNTCPTCETHVDAVDVYDGTELRCFACGAELVVVELADDAWSLQLIERGSGYDHDDESLLPNRKRIGATTESIALVANADGTGVVLAFDGRGIWSMIDGVGREIDNLGLDDGPSGISIWEGKCQSLGDGDDDAELVGNFRVLTPEEWKRLAETSVSWAFEESGEG